MTQTMAAGIAMGVSAAVFIISIIFNMKLTHLSRMVRSREKAGSRDCVTTGYFDRSANFPVLFPRRRRGKQHL